MYTSCHFVTRTVSNFLEHANQYTLTYGSTLRMNGWLQIRRPEHIGTPQVKPFVRVVR